MLRFDSKLFKLNKVFLAQQKNVDEVKASLCKRLINIRVKEQEQGVKGDIVSNKVIYIDSNFKQQTIV